MHPKIYCLSLFTLLASLTYGQSNNIRIPGNISLPKDTLIKEQLVRDLNEFLNRKDSSDAENGFISKAHFLETSLLLDEMKGVQKNVRYNDNNFYKPYLTNVIKTDEDTYLIQFSYIGTDKDTAMLRASFKLLAQNTGGRFSFFSPLSVHTKTWKTRETGNVVFKYKAQINVAEANQFRQLVTLYDGKTGASGQKTMFYSCDDFEEALKLVGVEYKAIYNGYSHLSLSTYEDHQTLIVSGKDRRTGFNEFDPHDLWHDRVHILYPAETINRPVDEGCAYLYGGSWGIAWKDILASFKDYAAKNKNADWLALYTSERNFIEGTKRLNIAYAINALIVQQLEREKGFAAVKELLCCGKREKGDEHYFRVLESVAGIGKGEFNGRVWRLLGEEL